MNEYYAKEIERNTELSQKSALQQASFFQNILLVSSSIVGILIALHNIPTASLYIRAVFAASISLALLGTLTAIKAAYGYSILSERVRQAHAQEFLSKIQTGQKLDLVCADLTPFEKACKKMTCTFLISSLILLVIYSLLVLFSSY